MSVSIASNTFSSLVLGTDLVDTERLAKIWQRFGEALFIRILTPAEWAYCQAGNPKQLLQRVGGRIALKEATAKALGVGLNGFGWNQGIHWQEVEVFSAPKAAPQIKLHGGNHQLGIVESQPFSRCPTGDCHRDWPCEVKIP